jgi:hypothetical protein
MECALTSAQVMVKKVAGRLPDYAYVLAQLQSLSSTVIYGQLPARKSLRIASSCWQHLLSLLARCGAASTPRRTTGLRRPERYRTVPT